MDTILPIEILFDVWNFLSDKELLIVSEVNWKCYQLARSESIWKRRSRQSLGHTEKSKNTWFETYFWRKNYLSRIHKYSLEDNREFLHKFIPLSDQIQIVEIVINDHMKMHITTDAINRIIFLYKKAIIYCPDPTNLVYAVQKMLNRRNGLPPPPWPNMDKLPPNMVAVHVLAVYDVLKDKVKRATQPNQMKVLNDSWGEATEAEFLAYNHFLQRI